MSEKTSSVRHAPDGLILLIACIAQFMVVLDVSIVNIALPHMRADLHFSSFHSLQWVVNAYALCYAGFLLLGGRAADLFGRRHVYVTGIALFVVASVVAGVAHNGTEMIIARSIQGLGGAVLSPATLTIIITTFQGEKLPRALGAWSAVAAAGGAVGGLLGGILTGWVSWRWVFFINVPLGIFALVIAGLYLREMRNKDATVKLDITGAALVTLSLFAFVYGIVHSSDVGLTSAVTLAWTGGGLAGIGLFAWWESQVASHPLIPFAVFRSSSLAVASVVMFFTGCAFFILWYFLTFYLQVVLQYGAVKAGFSFLPLAVAIIAGAQIAARKMSTTGTRPFIIGASALSAIGFWWLGHLHATGPYWSCVLLPGCLVTFAMGLMFSPLAATATWGIDRAEAGLASGVVNAARQLGGAMSLAVLGTVATDHTKSLITLSPADASVAGWNLGYQITAGILVVALLVALTLDPQVGKRTL